MATQMGEGGQNNNDRERLSIFLIETKKVLSMFVEFREILLPKYMQEEFNVAWQQVSTRIDEAVKILRGKSVQQEMWFKPYFILYPPDDLNKILEFYGLTGSQLDLKLNVFNHYYKLVFQEPSLIQLMTSMQLSDAQKKEKKWFYQ